MAQTLSLLEYLVNGKLLQMFSAFLYLLSCFASFSPQGTMIIPNLTSLLNQEGQWKFPHEFNPENFLNDKGEFVKPEAFMPFSAGMRA